MSMITDFEKFIGVNQVIAKSIKLRMAVETVFNDMRYTVDKEKEFEDLLTPKSDENKLLEKRFKKVTKKLQKLSEPLRQAVQDSIAEYRIDIGHDKCSDLERKEKSQNNQLTWEDSIAQHYGILLATRDINRFNDSINNLEEPLKNGDVLDLVNTITLIRQFRDLFEKKERLESKNAEAKENNRLNKQIEALSRLLEEQRTKKEKLTQTKPRNLGFACPLDPDVIGEIYDLMVDKRQISCELSDFQAIFSKKSKQMKEPIEWLILHNRKANKIALFTFIKMMLQLEIMPKEILRQSNELFKHGTSNIFPDDFTYPSKIKQHNTRRTNFKEICDSFPILKQVIKKKK